MPDGGIGADLSVHVAILAEPGRTALLPHGLHDCAGVTWVALAADRERPALDISEFVFKTLCEVAILAERERPALPYTM